MFSIAEIDAVIRNHLPKTLSSYRDDIKQDVFIELMRDVTVDVWDIYNDVVRKYKGLNNQRTRSLDEPLTQDTTTTLVEILETPSQVDSREIRFRAVEKLSYLRNVYRDGYRSLKTASKDLGISVSKIRASTPSSARLRVRLFSGRWRLVIHVQRMKDHQDILERFREDREQAAASKELAGAAWRKEASLRTADKSNQSKIKAQRNRLRVDSLINRIEQKSKTQTVKDQATQVRQETGAILDESKNVFQKISLLRAVRKNEEAEKRLERGRSQLDAMTANIHYSVESIELADSTEYVRHKTKGKVHSIEFVDTVAGGYQVVCESKPRTIWPGKTVFESEPTSEYCKVCATASIKFPPDIENMAIEIDSNLETEKKIEVATVSEKPESVIECPYCGSDQLTKNGTNGHGLQRWKCKSCGRSKSANGAIPGGRTNDGYRTKAIELRGAGWTYDQIAAYLEKSTQTIFRWVNNTQYVAAT